MNRFGLGFRVGAVLAVSAVASDVVLVLLTRAADSPGWSLPQRISLGLMVAILVAGLLAGLVATMHRPTRNLGWGILIGLVVTFVVTAFVVASLMWGGN